MPPFARQSTQRLVAVCQPHALRPIGVALRVRSTRHWTAHTRVRRFASGGDGGGGGALLQADFEHCTEQLRTHDPLQHLCLPFVPSPAREHVASLRAWNLEVMQTLLKSGASGAGPMRLSWWMNVVATLFKHGSCPHTPVGRALQDAVVRGGLSQEHFNVYFDRIGMLVADGTPATVAALQRAAEAEGALVKMAMECVCTANGVQGEQGLVEDAWSAAAHVGKAVRITALLKAIPAFAAKKKVYIPKEVCASVGLDVSSLLQGQASEELCRAVAALADVAGGHLRAARALTESVPPAARVALLPASIADVSLTQLEKAGFNVFELGPPPRVRLQWQLLRHYAAQSY